MTTANPTSGELNGHVGAVLHSTRRIEGETNTEAADGNDSYMLLHKVRQRVREQRRNAVQPVADVS